MTVELEDQQPVTAIEDEKSPEVSASAPADLPAGVLLVISRRTFNFILMALVLLGITAIVGMVMAARQNADNLAAMNAPQELLITPGSEGELFNQMRAEVLPEAGIKLPIRWGSWLPQLVEAGIIDMPKLEAAFASRGGLTEEQKSLLTRGSNDFITITNENSWFLVTVLWPLGLANHMDVNETSPINGDGLFNFASTGGWTLGQEKNGGAYFNKYPLIALTAEQEALVKSLAENSYRPCCNNSTFFQDCNHGSGLLGLMELGASQGLTRQQMAQASLAANSFWFPTNYLTMAVYLKAVKGIDWSEVNPEEILSFDYSSATGANEISQKAADLNLIPEGAFGAQCGVGAASSAATPGPTPIVNVSVDDDPAWGPPDAPVTIVQFGDYECPFCKRFHQETYPQLQTDYAGKIRFVYRDLPISSLHPDAMNAALAADCANEQGAFWAYHDLLFENQDNLSRPDLSQYATQLNLDVKAFDQCVDSGHYQPEIAKDMQDASSYGVQGAPTFFINGRPLVGAQPYAIFASMINEELAKIQQGESTVTPS